MSVNDDLNHIEEDQVDDKQEPKYKYLDQAMMDQVEDVFDVFDKGKEGFIKDTDLGSVMRGIGFNPTEEELKKLIKKVDQAGTGIELEVLYRIADQKLHDTDTIEELIEALKCFDDDQDGKIAVPEMRWAMTALGEQMDDTMVDGLITEADKEKTGYIEVEEFAKLCFGIKEKPKAEDEGKGKKDGKKNKK